MKNPGQLAYCRSGFGVAGAMMGFAWNVYDGCCDWGLTGQRTSGRL